MSGSIGPAASPAEFTADWLGQRVVFSTGALRRLPDEIDRLGVSRVLFIAGLSGELPDRVANLIGHRLAARWDDVRQHVPADLATRITDRARRAGADSVVSIGGGSATGLAKIVALETGLPVIAVPTTCAGSEMTPVWGRTDADGKRTGRDPRVLPATVIYDPLLLAGLPAALVGPSGMNALAHCVEALYAPGAEPLTSLTALEGARLLADCLPAAYQQHEGSGQEGSGQEGSGQEGSGQEGRNAIAQVLWASCLAGRSFGTVGGSLHHAVCHLLGGAADLPHAETHAVVLPQVVAFLLPELAAVAPRLASALGGEPSDVPGTLWDLGAAVGTPAGLRSLGLPEDSLPALARALVAKSPPSPRPLNDQDALALLTAAWHGDRPDPRPASAGPVLIGDLAPMTARQLTDAVMLRLQATPDPRLREIMTTLIRWLHGFVAEVRLTQSEWLAAIQFLTATGKICSDRRQEFILLSDTLGVSMLVDLLAEAGAPGSAGAATESTVLGPFYVPGSPDREYGASIVERPSGELAWVSGQVIDPDGNPIAGATLDVWQNADDMLYAVQNADAPPTNLRGRFSTRPDGRYAFLGVRPTDYPIPDDGPVGQLLADTGRHPWRPAHIHVIVSAPGYRPVATHIFDAESRYLGSDAVFAVKPSLVHRFERHEPGSAAEPGDTGPPGVPVGQSWYSLGFNFVLAPADQ